MKKILIIIFVFMAIVIVGLGLIKLKVNNTTQLILEATVNAIQGKTDYINLDIEDNIKSYLSKYQEDNLLSDESTIELLDGVVEFNESKSLLKQAKRRIMDSDDKPLEVELTPKQEMFKQLYSSETEDKVNDKVFEENDKYMIYLKDLDFQNSDLYTIEHKGLYIEILKTDYPKQTVSQRLNDLDYQNILLKANEKVGNTTHYYYVKGNGEIVTIDIFLEFFKVKGIKIID